MRLLKLLQLCILLLPTVAGAHSTGQFNQKLLKTEKYFQPIDQPAPDFALFNQNGDPVSLGDFRDRVVVLYFIYMKCPDICPLHTDFIAGLQETINATPMRDLVEFVGVTTDPRNDSFAAMQGYAPARGLDPVNWSFLTSGPDQLDATRDLVKQFGHSFEVAGDGYQVHGTITHVIDKQGRWRANFHGLDFKRTNLVLLINALSREGQGGADEHDHGESAPGLKQRFLNIFN